MSDDREKLLRIMDSLERDYRSGKLSADKYSYFRSKYEDKLNSIDAMEATKRIRSMQGKPSTNQRKRRKPTNKKKEEQDLVEKYIINPKKGDAKYNKPEKSSMDGGTFKLILVLVLVVAFTAGIAYGVFSFDFDNVSNTDSVAIVTDTAFPEIKEVVNITVTNTTYNVTEEVVNVTEVVDETQNQDIETTTDTSTDDSNNNYPSDNTDSQDSGNDDSQSDQGGSDQGGNDGSQSDQGGSDQQGN